MLIYKDKFTTFQKENTKTSYQSTIENFEYFLCKTYNSEINENNITRTQMISYNQYLVNIFNEERTISTHIYGIRSYFKFLYRKGYIESDPSTILESPQIKRKSPIIITPEDLEQMLDFRLNSLEDYRLRVIILILYYTGLKVSELVELEIDDVKENTLVVKNQFSGFRELPLNGVTIQSINQYLLQRDELNVYSQYLIHSKKGSMLNRKSLWRILNRFTDKEKFGSDINPNTFRENYIINKLCELQYFLGYDNLGSLMNYIHEHIKYQKTSED